MYLEEIAVLHCNYYHGNIHAFVLKTCISSKFSECISAIKRIFCTTEMYLSPSSFVYLCCFLFPAMHAKSAAFCVWEWRRYMKQLWQLWSQRSRVRRFLPWEVCSLDDPRSFAASNSLMHSIHRCTWKRLQFFIVIIIMATFMRLSWQLAFHRNLVNALAPSSVYSALSKCIYPRLLSCICVVFSFLRCMLKVQRFACGSEDVT